jgi:hypothetical protein
MNQSNLVTSRDRIFLCTPRFAIQHAVASLLHGYLDQFLQQRVSACRRDFRMFSSDGVFDNHTLPFEQRCTDVLFLQFGKGNRPRRAA